jgi:uncharacterized phage protein gp47/JayE
MAITLQQLQDPISEDEALEFVIDILQELGFSATSWQEGSVPLAMITMFAKCYSSLAITISEYSKMSFNETSTNTALSSFSISQYDNTREAATKTQGIERLTNASGAPHVITIGQLVVEEENDAFTYRNTTAGTIAAGGTLDVTIEAEVAGEDRNVALNTITILQTPLSGVTVTNPDIGGGTWITSAGTDEESDPRLRARNRLKWATRTYSTPAEGYVVFALESSENITRAVVDDSNPSGPGTLDVYIAGASGVSSAQDVTDAQTYIDARRPITSNPTVIAAASSIQNFVGTVYIETAKNNAATQAAIEQAVTDYINDLDIGGTVLTGVQGYALQSEIITAISSIDGVENVALTTPSADVPVTAWEILVVGTFTFTYTSV